MPLNLEDEATKKEVDALLESKLKELGVDGHAKDVITRLNGESKTHREAKEAADKKAADLEKKAADLEKKIAALSAGDEKRKAELEAEKKRIEDEKKTVEERINERLTAAEKTFNESLAKLTRTSDEQVKQLSKELKARDAALVAEAVRSSAGKRGIIDDDLIKLFDVAEIKVENGVVDRDAVEKMLDVQVEAKPNWFKPAEDRSRDTAGRFARPDAKSTLDKKSDASKMTPEQFENLEAQLRSARA